MEPLATPSVFPWCISVSRNRVYPERIVNYILSEYTQNFQRRINFHFRRKSSKNLSVSQSDFNCCGSSESFPLVQSKAASALARSLSQISKQFMPPYQDSAWQQIHLTTVKKSSKLHIHTKIPRIKSKSCIKLVKSQLLQERVFATAKRGAKRLQAFR